MWRLLRVTTLFCLLCLYSYISNLQNEPNLSCRDYFTNAWQKYLQLRRIEDGASAPVFPDKYDFAERDKFVKSVSFSGWGGASGHDAPMIAWVCFWKKSEQFLNGSVGMSEMWHIINISTFLEIYDGSSTQRSLPTNPRFVYVKRNRKGG